MNYWCQMLQRFAYELLGTYVTYLFTEGLVYFFSEEMNESQSPEGME